MAHEIDKTDEQWRAELSPEQYEVLRRAGTEAPWSGKFVHNHDAGTYRCVCCDEPLFVSDAKFDSGCGWPSFTLPVAGEKIDEHEDRTHGMRRVEVTCHACGAHLGHVFDDGPAPTGLRYCINSASLKFEKK